MALCCLLEHWLLWSTLAVLVLVYILFIVVRQFFQRRKIQYKTNLSAGKSENADQSKIVTVAFFHPYCNAGGGGERVLWLGIKSLQDKFPGVKCYVYTGDTEATPENILSKAQSRFGLTMLTGVTFVYLKKRRYVEASLYPYFTLLIQSLGSMILGLEALCSFVPDIFVDSMGYSFVTPLFRYLAGSNTASYVHYPTISTDMLELVRNRRENFNNKSFISRSRLLSLLKWMYYCLFSKLYGLCGRSNQLVMVNSSWTYNHISQFWARPAITKVIFPPCDVATFTNLSNEQAETLLADSTSHVRILSVGQFRPEKDHSGQLKCLSALVNDAEFNADEQRRPQVKLVFVGGCRDDDDRKRVDALKVEAEQLGLEDFVVWKLNASFEELKNEFKRALIGLHAMKDEHFGIGVVECMAAGLITVAHRSGGPLLDIVKDGRNGFLADSAEEYAATFAKIVRMSREERDEIRRAARASCQRFSDDNFRRQFVETFQTYFHGLD